MLLPLLPLLTLALSFFSLTLAQTLDYEAEDGILNGGTMVDTATAGYSGTGYVAGFANPEDSVTITIVAPSAGLYDLSVTYATPYGEKYTSVSLNGVPNGQLFFPASDIFATTSGGQVLLELGTNTITFTNNWGWYFIDKISLAPSSPPPAHQVTAQLTNPNASDGANKLMSFLVSQYGEHILSGQQEPAYYRWIQQNIGKSPAIIGLDMMDYSPSRVSRGTTSTAVEDAVAFDANSTIVNFCWHWNAPTDLIDDSENPWWSGFYTRATTFDLEAALAEGPIGTNYQLLISDMDAIAEKLKLLQTANVPVIWRPLHEAEGGWFWWGRDKNPEPAKQLYRIMYDRYTNYHGLNNLIWVWNSVGSDWYPGDDVVDILSYDSYPTNTGDHGAVSGPFQQLVTLGQDKKLVTLSEVGEIPDPDLLQAYHADWSYWVTWGGEFITDNQHNALDFLLSLYNSEYVLNWDRIQGWKEGDVVVPTLTYTYTPTSMPPSSTTSTPTSTNTLPPASATIYEAELGTLNGGTQVENTSPGYSGTGYVSGFANPEDSVTITVSSDTTATYTLYVTYQAPYGEKYTALSVNGVSQGQVYFPEILSFDTVEGPTITLYEGSNTITFTNDWGWYFIDMIALDMVAVTTATRPTQTSTSTTATASATQTVVPSGVKYEAEDGVLTGSTTTVDTATSGYSGSGYVTGFTDDTCSVTITVTADSTGLYDMFVGYAAPYGEKYTSVSLNDQPNGQLYLPAIDTFSVVSGGQLLLNSGSNTITFTNNWGWYFIDYVQIAPAAPPPPHQVTAALNNPNASDSAKTLMSYLVSQYGQHILSGQQDPASYAWIQENIGKSPAIIGLDMIDYTPSRVERGTTSRAVEDAIAFDGNQTIVNFCWHWNAPTGLIDSSDYPWWWGFYTEGTTFDLAAALAEGTSGTNYQLLIRDMDVIAEKLKLLQAANVPVIWRPLHEAEGGWFWWGRDKNPEPAKQLYRIMYDRYTNYHGLNNLIWVWNSVAASWYPGDDVVDILAYDSYPATTGDHGAVSGPYQQLVALGQDKKLVTLSEVGEIPDPGLLQAYHADWSYWVAWGGEWIQDGTHNSLSFLIDAYNHLHVFNWDDIQGWKGVPPTTTTSSLPSTTSSTSSTSMSSTGPTMVSSSSSTVVSSTSTSSTSTSISMQTSTQTSSSAIPTQTLWGQCGGTYYHGPTQCGSGMTCVAVSPPWYYQCLIV